MAVGAPVVGLKLRLSPPCTIAKFDTKVSEGIRLSQTRFYPRSPFVVHPQRITRHHAVRKKKQPECTTAQPDN